MRKVHAFFDGLRCHPWAMACLWIIPAAMLPTVPIDETRYLSVAWEMRRTGDAIGLTLNGLPYMDKSPLLFWLINVAWMLFGVSTLTARMVCIAFAAGTIAATSRIAHLLGHRDPASVGWLMLPFIVFGAFSPVVMFDVPLLFFVTLGFAGLVQWITDRRWYGPVIFLIAAILGLLAKGPVYLLHMAGPLCLMRWWHGRTIPHATRLVGGIVLCLVMAAVPLAAWATISASRLHGTSLLETLTHQSVGRVAESFAHRRPLYWYLPWLLPFLLPWSLLLGWMKAPLVFRHALKGTVARFGVASSLPACVAFSLVSGKQIHYLIPLLPGFAMVLAAMREHDATIFSHGRVRFVLASSAIAWVWLAATAVIGMQGNATWYIAAVLSTLFLFGGALLTAWGDAPERERLMRASSAALLALISMVLLLGTHLKANMDPRDLATAVKSLQRDGIAMAVVNDEPGLINYLARLPTPLPVITDNATWIRSHPDGYALVHASHGLPPSFVNTPIILTDGWEGLVPAANLDEVHP